MPEKQPSILDSVDTETLLMAVIQQELDTTAQLIAAAQAMSHAIDQVMSTVGLEALENPNK